MNLELGSARGGAKRPKGGELLIEVVRELTEGDVELLVNPPPLGSKPPALVQLRHNHHELARLLAGGMSSQEAQLITGLSGSRISILKNDPAFRELMEYYSAQRELKFIDVMERMRVVGLSTLDEIQERLETSPKSFSNRELAEITELLLVKGRGPTAAAASGGPPVNVNIHFPGVAEARVIEGDPVSE